jgi:hypothetical protein
MSPMPTARARCARSASIVRSCRPLLVCALPALLAASAHAVPLVEAPLPDSAYVTKNGYQWAWMFAVAPDGSYAGFVPDMGYQASLGWRLPTRTELDLWAPTPSDFLFPGANVPLGGADPVSNAWFAYPTAALSGPGACASAYFVDRDGYNHCDWGNGPGVGEYWDGTGLVDLSLPWWNSSAWATAGSPTWAETLAVRRIAEPATVSLLGLGLAGIGAMRRRRTAS